MEYYNEATAVSSYSNAISSNFPETHNSTSFNVHDDLAGFANKVYYIENINSNRHYFFRRIDSLVRLIHFQFCRYFSLFFSIASTFVYNLNV